MRTSNKVLLILGSLIGVGAVLFSVFLGIFHFGMHSTVMKKTSPDREHSAKLVRVDLIDVNFAVSVDGRRVYRSPDFRPIRADFREQLVWDTDSQVVFLEVAGRRIFGYHVLEKRPLTDPELFRVHVTPFEELHYEGRLPSETPEKMITAP